MFSWCEWGVSLISGLSRIVRFVSFFFRPKPGFQRVRPRKDRWLCPQSRFYHRSHCLCRYNFHCSRDREFLGNIHRKRAGIYEKLNQYTHRQHGCSGYFNGLYFSLHAEMALCDESVVWNIYGNSSVQILSFRPSSLCRLFCDKSCLYKP